MDPSLLEQSTEQNFKTPFMGSILGILWAPATDRFCIKLRLPQTDGSNPTTKREFLLIASRIFDPLGILAPVIVRFKILMRDV